MCLKKLPSLDYIHSIRVTAFYTAIHTCFNFFRSVLGQACILSVHTIEHVGRTYVCRLRVWSHTKESVLFMYSTQSSFISLFFCCPAFSPAAYIHTDRTENHQAFSTATGGEVAGCRTSSGADRQRGGQRIYLTYLPTYLWLYCSRKSMAGRLSSSPGAGGAPGAVVVAAAVAVGLVVGAGGLMAVLLLRERRERGSKAAAGACVTSRAVD